MSKRIYVICPVRGATESETSITELHVRALEAEGNKVFWPTRDAPQGDAGGMGIVLAELQAMGDCERVDVIWQPGSKGSHFDLGMAFALLKPLRLVAELVPDGVEKSYAKVMRAWPWGTE